MPGNENSGRKLKIKSAKKLQKKIDEYFNSCLKPQLNKFGEPVLDGKGNIVYVQSRPYTMTGLADCLNISRKTLKNYEFEPKFADIIERAKRKCEVYAEERLFDKDGVNGAKFNLINNYEDWKEKSENVNLNANTSYEDYIKRVESDEEY